MSNLQKPEDPNPILQDVIATARKLYKGLLPRGECNVSCSRSLLDRGDPEPQPVAPYDRLTAWATAAGMSIGGRDGTLKITIRRK